MSNKHIILGLVIIACLALVGIVYNVSQDDTFENLPNTINSILDQADVISPFTDPVVSVENEVPSPTSTNSNVNNIGQTSPPPTYGRVIPYPQDESALSPLDENRDWNLMLSDPNMIELTMALTYTAWEAEGKPDPKSRCAQPDYPAAIEIELGGETLRCLELLGMTQNDWIKMKTGQ